LRPHHGNGWLRKIIEADEVRFLTLPIVATATQGRKETMNKETEKETRDLISQIMDYECGMMDDEETLALFSELISSGMAWTLQGSYGRTARTLIELGYISNTGEILYNSEGE
jgi:hypothetical protein